MITTDQILKFFVENPAINKTEIENEAKIPSRTIHKATSGIEIPAKHLPSIESVIRRYGYKDSGGAKVISIVNNKGGVGKTTTTINLGKALSVSGYRVLMIDMDSQGNLSQCYDHHSPEKQVIDSLISSTPLPLIEITETLFLSPSDIRMSGRESELKASIGADRRLALLINQIKPDFDYILIDCPPSLQILTEASLVASDYCLVPIQPEASSFHGVVNLFNTIAEIRKFLNTKLEVKGIVFTMVSPQQNVHKQMMEHIRDTYKHFHFFDTIITEATVIAQSQSAKEDLFTYAEKSKSWNQYQNLATEIIK